MRSWIIAWRGAKAKRGEIRTMSGLELHEVGLERVDVPSVGWDAWIDTRVADELSIDI